MFSYVEKFVFFKYRRVIFNFKMHMTNLLPIFEISVPLNKRPVKNEKNLKSAPGVH